MKSLHFKAAALVMAVATGAQAQEACTRYTVQPGDSLSGIARTAYGSISYQTVWDANRSVIGSNPNDISVGMRLRLPCADGSLPGGGATTASVAAPAPAPEVSSSGPVTIRLVTGSDYAPFTQEDMAGGGIYTQLVRAAMDTLEPQYDTSIIFVNDWDSHLDTLLPAHAFDGSFPWLKPACDKPETLTPTTSQRCEDLLFSDPFYEIVNGLIVNANSPLATTNDYADFHGTTICLPEGYVDAPLAAGGLTEPVVTYFRPVNPDDCFSALVDGEIDAISLEVVQADDIASRLGLVDQVASNPNLTSVKLMSVYVQKSNPQAEQVIAALNQGLKNIRDNGVWFQTVRTGFADYYGQ